MHSLIFLTIGAAAGIQAYRVFVRHLIRYFMRKDKPPYAELAFRVASRLVR